MKKKLINIFTNGSQFSLETQADLTKKLVDRGYTVTREYSQDAELIICIGGDGSLLETVHSCNFPECPIIGINTGHLGFFQELSPDDLDHFISDYENGQYTIQPLRTAEPIDISGSMKSLSKDASPMPCTSISASTGSPSRSSAVTESWSPLQQAAQLTTIHWEALL